MTMWRAQLLALSLLAWLLPTNAHAALLLSADVSITSTTPGGASSGYVNYNFSANDMAVVGNQSGTGCEPGQSTTGGNSCVFEFSLTATGFSFQQECMAVDFFTCRMPSVTITLTDLKFAGGEVLANAALVETQDIAGAPVPDLGVVQGFTANSITLTIASFVAQCQNILTDTVSFTTRALPTGENVPEPTTLSLLGAGLAGLAWWRRRRTTAA